jgi:hypothetical protein
MNRLALILVSTLLLAGAALAQDSVPLPPGAYRMKLQGPVMAEPPFGWLLQDLAGQELAAREALFLTTADLEVIKNAPFTGTVVTETSQTLSDGNHITTKTSGFEARDSQGRTRREQALGRIGPVQVDAPKIVLISDPVSQTDYMLQPDGQTARVLKHLEIGAGIKGDAIVALKKRLQETATERHRGERPIREEKVDVKHEDLGTEEIEGVSCHGSRDTRTIPAGQIGNEQPIVITTEIWTSDDLHRIVLKKHSDPRFGDSVYRLTNIKLGEPDASLFKVPSNYKIIKPETHNFD